MKNSVWISFAPKRTSVARALPVSVVRTTAASARRKRTLPSLRLVRPQGEHGTSDERSFEHLPSEVHERTTPCRSPYRPAEIRASFMSRGRGGRGYGRGRRRIAGRGRIPAAPLVR